MQLVLQNSKELKEVRHFIKALNYVYDSSNFCSSRTVAVYLYLSPSYIALANNFMDGKIPDYRICFCRLKNHMYKLTGFANEDDDGIIYRLDVETMMLLLNSQMEPDTTQLTLTFPSPQTIKYN